MGGRWDIEARCRHQSAIASNRLLRGYGFAIDLARGRCGGFMRRQVRARPGVGSTRERDDARRRLRETRACSFRRTARPRIRDRRKARARVGRVITAVDGKPPARERAQRIVRTQAGRDVAVECTVSGRSGRPRAPREPPSDDDRGRIEPGAPPGPTRDRACVTSTSGLKSRAVRRRRSQAAFWRSIGGLLVPESH